MAIEWLLIHQWGEIGENNLGDVGFFFIFNVCYGILGVYIIPKWLINDS